MTPKLMDLKSKTLYGMANSLHFIGSGDDPDTCFDAGYTQTHVDRCAKIIDELYAALSTRSGAKRDEDNILEAVKMAVLRLNELNELCEGNLIEPEQHEDLCELITFAAKQAGLKRAKDEDITEPWREW
jgi:hypothetical protein